MKKVLLSLMAVGLLALSGYSQVLNTNTNPPTISGPFIDFLGTLTTATNWGVTMFGIYTPKSSNPEKHGGGVWGVGALALYNFNQYMGAGVGIDWLDNEVTMPSAQFQVQAPFRIGGTNGIIIRPVAFTGVSIPVAGDSPDNGTVEGLVGAGLALDIYKGFKVFYAIEQRTGQPASWQLFGVEWSKSF